VSEAPRLARRIGLGGALLLAFNGAIGASIFALPATLAADFGTFAPWLFPIVGAAFLLIAVPFARSVAAFPENGGPATYGRVFGRLAGFELGWVYYVARAAAFAANLNVLIAYVARWWTGAAEGAPRIALMLAAVAILTAINIAGVQRAMRTLGGLTLLKTVPLIVTAIAALALAGVPAPGPLPPLGQAEAGVLLVFYAFVGFENATVTAARRRGRSGPCPARSSARSASSPCCTSSSSSRSWRCSRPGLRRAVRRLCSRLESGSSGRLARCCSAPPRWRRWPAISTATWPRPRA
jgi:amino acid transporter